jgi:hypothetical protein
MSDTWFDDLVTRLEESLASGEKISWKGFDGDTVLIEIKNELVDLIKDNRSMLVRIGRDTFKRFLQLWSERKEFDALVVVYDKLDNTELISKYKEDSARLAEVAAQIQAERDFWISFGKKVGTRVLLGFLGSLL